ncbi:putative lipase [Penicillium rolfsii]|nr:putative lipase [Penicillium rolfsii]
MADNTPKADHLCVLVHGLWGNPSHLDFVASALRERHDEDTVHILCAKNNSGNWTYDGIELGGERLAHEIEETLEKLDKTGQKIKKLSIIGYSLGGLVSRYAIGLLHAQGWLEKVEPVNFTTFASPHVGVRTPLKGIRGRIWNGLGPKTVSMSGQQLFLVDSFRNTGRPLLSVLADPESIFIQGLKKFRNRSVYANVVNDRTVVFYTSAISKTDPFKDLDNIHINYVEGYDQVIVDPDNYLLPTTPEEPETGKSRWWKQLKKVAHGVPFWLLIILVVPPAMTIFLVNAAVQTFRSRQRIRLHSEGKNSLRFGRYKVPLLVQDVHHAMEEVFENVNARQEPSYLSSTEEDELSDSAGEKGRAKAQHLDSVASGAGFEEPSNAYIGETDQATGHCHKLALTDDQFAIIDSLNTVGFRKYPVYIHNHRHSHAAIIVRIRKDGFDEGKLVMKHWLDNEFAI